MAKETIATGSIVTSKNNVETDEFKGQVFKKSEGPKTPKETLKLVLNLFLNLFS